MSKIEKVFHGDALNVLKTFESNSIDSVCCDPPYGLSKEPDINEVLTKWLAGEEYDHGHGGFMGKSWDSFVPHPDIWREVFRVLKPGGHALVFAGTRTQDLMTISLRLAGFEVRDVIEWLYFSGFPKSHDVSKAFDRRAGELKSSTDRFVDVGGNNAFEGRKRFRAQRCTICGKLRGSQAGNCQCGDDYAPATELARKWDGWGTALKPAHEPIIVVRKPLIDADTGRKLTIADCVEKYGTGAINIDASRIALRDENPPTGSGNAGDSIYSQVTTSKGNSGNVTPEKGRFPANCITLDSNEFYSKYFNITPPELSKKASKKDRNSDWQGEEIDGINVHPTVKNTDLMAWLVRLVTPKGGTVLDPFAGSGSTLVAAKREGFGFIGVELSDEYIPIIEARVGAKSIGLEAQSSEG